MTNEQEFAHWITEPEGVRLEFKTALQRYDFEKLVDYCVALANEGGGKILLGVTDQRPRTVTGTAAFAEPGRTEAGLYQRLGQRVPVEEFRFAGKRVLVVHVPGRLPGTVWHHNGRYLRRAGDDLVPIPIGDLRAMLDEVGPDYSAEPSAARLSDLLPEALNDFRRRWARRAANQRIEQWNDEELLGNAELTIDGRITIAALVLFGTRAALGRHLAQAEIVFEYRSSEASGPAQDRETYRAGFLGIHDALWQKINLRNDRQSYQDGLFRNEIFTFDEKAVREALLNAVAHRDYRLGGSVFVRQYARRLEIVSPGGFPSGITTENFLDRQNPRNRRLAEVLERCGLVERAGQGLNLMFETAIRQSKPLPDFTGSDAYEVHLTLPGTMQDAAFVRFLERIGQEQLRAFSTHDFLTLDALRRDVPLSETMRARLPTLLDAGIVESHGRGSGVRYLLSRGLYAALGAKGVYTRKRGLDHDTNKELLCKHIRENNAEGSPISDLHQVLPAMSRKQLTSLLNELRDEGRIRLVGQRRWARWHWV